MRDLVTVQNIILRSCQHEHRPCEVNMGRGETIFICTACWNRGYYARKAARKAQLACRTNDCQKCGRKPVTKLYDRYRLCGRCFAAVKKEHGQNMAGCSMPWLVTTLLIDTKDWAIVRGNRDGSESASV